MNLKLKARKITTLGIFILSPYYSFATTHNYNWNDAWIAPNGISWSKIIDDASSNREPLFGNCVSKKDAQGNPLYDEPGFEHIYVLCERKADGSIPGISEDGKTIIDSDAIQMCKEIGGELPTLEDYIALGSNIDRLPGEERVFVWTSSTASGGSESAMIFDEYQNEALFTVRSNALPVRCIKRPTK